MKIASGQQPETHPNDNQAGDWRPPRGIRYSYRADRPDKPFYLHWGENGERNAAAYSSPSAREKAAKELAAKRIEHGADVLTFDPRQWRQWITFREMIGDADPLHVAQEWLTARRQNVVAATMSVADASDSYLKARAADGVSKGTLSHARMDMRRFVAQFGERVVSDLKPDEIRAWLAALPFAEVTKRNHYRRVRAFYNWARLEGLSVSNPCDNVRSPAREAEEVCVLSVEDTKKLFNTARSARPEVCARLALEAFAGLRFSSAARLVKTDVNFSDKGITLPASKIKTRRRHYIEGLPENLWAWLRIAPAAAWTMTERQYLALKSDVFRLAQVRNPGNVLRHSFCSYHVAQHKDAARTAVILCHASPRMIYQHYKGRATAAAAAAYFNIKPRAKAAP